MLAEKARFRTLAGCDIWIGRVGSLAFDRAALAGLGLAELGLTSTDPATLGLKLGRSSLGRPLLLAVDGTPLGFSVSYTSLAGQLWAAVSAAPGLGVDAASAAEFVPPYPEDRVFTPEERRAALAFCPEVPDALSLLWSLKEAAAKALGIGFNRVEPIELTAAVFQPTLQGFACEVRAPALILPALAERLPNGWISVAVAGGLKPEHYGVEQ